MTARVEEAARAADAAARAAAQTSFERPLLLVAGAGTGKTAALVARIVAWSIGSGWEEAERRLAERQPPPGIPAPPTGPDAVAARVLERVVAITFTEAAAAEMASRVAEALAAVAEDRTPVWILAAALPADAVAREGRARALLTALDRLVVCTIHAFCRRVLSRNPVEAGLHPSFTVDAEGDIREETVREVIERWLRRTLAGTPPPEMLELARRGIGPGRIADAVEELAGAGLPEAALAADPLAPARVTALAGRVGAAVGAVAAIVVPRFSRPSRAANAVALAEALGGLPERVAAAASLAELRAALETALDERLVGHLAKWGRGSFNKAEEAALGGAAVALVAAARALHRLLRHALGLDEALLRAVHTVVAPLVDEVRQTMRRRGAQTFDALLRDARDLLIGRPDVAARERGAISQLLVDEFQDTDPLQCEIVRALALAGPAAERPGLFLVGDPKQSIYGWRDADLAAYHSFAETIAACGEVRELTVNFRSVPAILAEVERCVRPVMVPERDVQPEFQTLLPGPERAAAPGFRRGRWAPVEFWVSWPEPGDAGGKVLADDATRLEAATVARDIRTLHDEAGAAWSGFGLLARSTGDLDVYLQELRDADVPYVVERDRSYYRRREVIEAGALVRAVLDPADHLALVTVLRSAVVGVPDAALVPLWARRLPALFTELRRPDERLLAAVASAARDVAAAPPADVPGIERVRGWEVGLAAFARTLAELRESFERDPAVTFIEHVRVATLLEATEAARTLGRFRVANLERFFRRLLGAVEAAGADVEGVLRALRAAVAEEREGEEARPERVGEDAVRILTIHKAKGLHFDHVYLLQTHHGSGADRDEVARAREVAGAFEFAALGARTPGWDLVAARAARTAEAELVRTLYVAMTRARERLVVAGAWPRGGKGGAAGAHVRLLAARRPAPPDLEALAGRLPAAGAWAADDGGARWVLPALAPAAAPAAPGAAVVLPDAAAVASESARLAVWRDEARARMARPFSAPASEEAHRLLRELLAGGEAAALERRHGAARDRSAATAAGSAVHAVLEQLDLGVDLESELARGAERLAAAVARLAEPDATPTALGRARELLQRFRDGPLAARLRTIAPHVVARELDVLLPPGGGAGGPVGFVAGAIDLLYRDPASHELVIADYKTDDVATAAEIEERARAYAPQGATYRRAVQEALGLERPPRFELWFLRTGSVVDCV